MILEIAIGISATVTFIPLIRALGKKNEIIKELNRKLKVSNDIAEGVVKESKEIHKDYIFFDANEYRDVKAYIDFCNANNIVPKAQKLSEIRMRDNIKIMESTNGKSIFHGSCHSCKSQEMYTVARCYYCKYFNSYENSKDLSI